MIENTDSSFATRNFLDFPCQSMGVALSTKMINNRVRVWIMQAATVVGAELSKKPF